jgi:hypothetical protein
MSRSHWSGRAYIGFPLACSSNSLIGFAEKYSIFRKRGLKSTAQAVFSTHK